jgi:hypothetical protein
MDDNDTMPCPHCGQAVYDDTERCPHCENYLSREDAPSNHPLWLVVGVVTCLILVALWILRNR